MKNSENRIVHLNPEIIEAFENDNEMLLIKGGTFGDWLRKLAKQINVVCPSNNCPGPCINDCDE